MFHSYFIVYAFDLYKVIDGKENPLWNDIVDLKLINVVGFKRYEITVSKTDTNDIVKTVVGKSLECELARPVYDLHINDDDYFEYQSEANMDSNGNIISIKYYNPTDEDHSLLHLLLADKAPDWSIGHVPPYLTITNLGKKDFIPAHSFQRTFTIDGQTIYDFLVGDLAAETNTVYDFDTYNRIINIYDKFEIGEDTNTFINNRNLANSIKVEGNADNLKNCFKVIGGDDVITNYLSVVNLTGNYIWQFSDLQYNDMPEDLANAIKEYISYKDELSDEYYGGYDIFNKLIESGKEVDTTLKLCGTVPNMTSLPLPTDDNLGCYYYVSSVNQYYVSNGTEWVICGAFTRLCSAYDYMSYLTNTMMPSVSLKTTTADAQAQIVESDLLTTTVAVSNLSIYNDNSFDGITNNVVAYAKVILDSRYQIESVKEVSNYPRYNASSQLWTGKLKITKRTDENDTKTFVVSVNINDNELNFAKQKIMKALANNSMTDVDNDVLAYTTSVDMTELVNYFQKYCLHSLESFYNGYQACLSVLMSLQSSSANSSVYDSLYNTYRIRLSAVEQVYHLRQAQVDEQQLLIYQITTEKNQLQNKADFKTYLNNINPTYWKLFNSYRREDTYQNDNYVSDGLTDGQIIAKCKELLDYANYQISMACQLQRTLSVDMNNLMIMKEFEPFWDKFAIYNYIRVQTDDEVLKLRLMQIDIDFSSIDQLNVSFAENISGNGNVLNDVADTIMQMNNIATSYNSTKQQVEQSQYKISQVGEWINNGLNASKVMITTSDENEVTVNNYGINLKDMSDEGNYGSFQTRLIGKGFFFTTDDWETVATALGQIYIKDSETDGHWATGLIADNIIGQLIAGQSLKITNDKGSVVIDGDTAKFTDISIHYTDANGNYVHIGGDSSRIFSIGSNGVEQMYFNSDLNRMVYSGDITAATITGGSINGTNITGTNISGGTVSGTNITGSTITGNTISGGTVNGATITGGTIYIENGGKVGDFTISDGELSYGNFGVFGDTAQFMNISPKGKISTIYLDANNYMYALWAFSSTAFGVTTYGDVYSHSVHTLSCDGTDYACPNVKWVNENRITSNTSAVYEASSGDFGGGANVIMFKNSYSRLNGAPTTQYVQNYVQNYVTANMPNTSNFSPVGHTHTITPSKDLPSEGSGSHNFMYGFNAYSGTNGFSYTYGYVSGSLSDRRLKENIRPIEDITDKYMALEPIKFNFYDDIKCVFKGTHYGFIAQDVAEVFDDDDLAIVCREHQESESANRYLNGDDAYVLDKDELHALHVQMIQKQQKEIESLKQQNMYLEQQNISLDGRIAILEQIVNQLSSQVNQITN